LLQLNILRRISTFTLNLYILNLQY
jgi:hypothetical protein